MVYLCNMQRVHITVHGYVQGVFFRSNTQRVAKNLGLKGYVRNKDDTVEVVAEGPEEKIRELIKFCKKGPEAAKVDKIDVHIEEASGEFDGFEVRH